MLFNSSQFLVFLSVVLVLYYALPHNRKNLLLLIASYIFYAFWNWKFCSLIALSTIVDFACGKYIYESETKIRQRVPLIISLVVNLSLLGFFKYFNFFESSFQELFRAVGLNFSTHTLRVILPVGISFYTFQTLSYTLDIYRGTLKPTKSFWTFALYVSFFPQLVAGPIERARNLLPQFEGDRVITRRMISQALILILTGYIKKVLISDQLASSVEHVFSSWQVLSSLELFKGLVFFSVQIYFDFSGYSDIARGVAKLFGVELMLNFRQPYFSVNIVEFWRRWHISLSTWLRDYLYIPLGGNRRGTGRTYYNLMVTMLLGGLWHGANWTFVAWGGLHGLYLVVYKLFGGTRETNALDGGRFKYLITNIHFILLTYLLVLVTWLLFRSPDIGSAAGYFMRMVSFTGGWDWSVILFLLIVFGAGCLIDLPAYILDDQYYMERVPLYIRIPIFIVLTALIVLLLCQQNVDRAFIYFQF
jgi:D-alanyl-lipoteichoic acid acyltransferase DltB (MBOAT superfamily)